MSNHEPAKVTFAHCANERLQSIEAGMSQARGGAFHRLLVHHLAASLGWRYALVGELMDAKPQRARTLAIWAGEDFGEDFEYELAGTPGDGVVKRGLVFHPRNVRKLFPEDRLLAEMGVESYLGVPLVNSSGRTLGTLAVMHDRAIDDARHAKSILTIFAASAAAELEHARAEAALRQGEEYLRSIHEAAEDAILVVDPRRDRIVEANPKACKMLGYTPEEFSGMPASKLHPNEMPHLSAFWAEVFANGVGRTDKLTCTTKTNQAIPVEISASVVQIKDQQYALAMVRDITERKRVEAERARLAAVVEQAAESIFITDTEGTIQYVNAAFERITGYGREEVIGHNARILRSAKHDEAFYQELWRAITHGEVWRGRLVSRKKDGTLFEEKRTVFPIRDASGVVVNYVGVAPDIAQEVALEAQLRHAQKMEAVGTLAAGLAHDFNNLLAVIRGHAEMAKNRTADEELLKSLSAMEEAVEQATGVTRSLLTFSQRVPAQKTPIDLCAAVEKAARMLQSTFPPSIDFLVDTRCEPAPWVNADPTQLQQIVFNLAINARDAMPRGGVLRISVSPPTTDGAELSPPSHSAGMRCAQLIVEDTGGGMSREIQSRIFEPFFTTKSRGRGTGLGLAIIHGIIEDHAGRIQVSSEADHGTTFTISLPCVPPDSPDVAVERDTDEPAGHGELILLASGKHQVRAILAATLLALGYEVVQATDGDTLLACFEQDRIRVKLFILDMDLPQRNGVDCLRDIRATGANAPAILISGNVDTETAKQLDNNTILLAKPFQTAEFGGIVSMLATRRREEADV